MNAQTLGEYKCQVEVKWNCRSLSLVNGKWVFSWFLLMLVSICRMAVQNMHGKADRSGSSEVTETAL